MIIFLTIAATVFYLLIGVMWALVSIPGYPSTWFERNLPLLMVFFWIIILPFLLMHEVLRKR